MASFSNVFFKRSFQLGKIYVIKVVYGLTDKNPFGARVQNAMMTAAKA